MSKVKDFFTPRNVAGEKVTLVDIINAPYFRLATLTTIAGTLAYFIGANLPMVSGVTAAITAIVSVRHTFHDSIQGSFLQILGVVIGGTVAFAAMRLVGFNSKSATWTTTRVTFGDELRESSEKDPNLEAVGIGGQIYGKRADMIIVDDAVTLKNANEFEKQIRWLTQDVRSRLNPTGKLIVIGTRVASVDLYKELRSPDRYPGGLVPWTYLAMPALLEPNEDPDKWVTLWPYSDAPFDGQAESDKNEEGLYPRWNGKHLYAERQAMDASTWALIYQQQDISDDAIFDPVCVKGSIDGMRKAGRLVPGSPGHPKDLNGFSFVCGPNPSYSIVSASLLITQYNSTPLCQVLFIASP